MLEWEPPADQSLGCPEVYDLQICCNSSDDRENIFEPCMVIDCKGNKYGDPSLEDCNAFVTNLKACVKYIFRIRCCTAKGWSIWSELSDQITTLGRF